jgi:hypothetical protein
MVYWCYIYTEQQPKGFCKRFGFDLKKVAEIAKMEDWDSKKERQKERLYKTFAKNRLEKMERRQELLDMLETHDLAAIEELVDDFETEVGRNGYLVRAADGTIARDPRGNPIVRTVPKHIKESIRENIELLEQNTKALISANTTTKMPDAPMLPGEEPKTIEGVVLDFDNMEVGEDEPKDDK